jgi:hypothetical protein
MRELIAFKAWNSRLDNYSEQDGESFCAVTFAPRGDNKGSKDYQVLLFQSEPYFVSR